MTSWLLVGCGFQVVGARVGADCCAAAGADLLGVGARLKVQKRAASACGVEQFGHAIIFSGWSVAKCLAHQRLHRCRKTTANRRRSRLLAALRRHVTPGNRPAQASASPLTLRRRMQVVS
jgi:hypothetical protein